MNESNFGKGAIPKKRDLRDKKWSKIAKASIPFDWSKATDNSVPNYPFPTKNQGTSDSCGGQSGAYLDQALANQSNLSVRENSARYIYSQIFYKGGGTTLRDILNFLVKKGVASERTVPSLNNGNPPTETFMTDKSANTPQADSETSGYRGASYAFVNPDIDSVAQAIRDTGGAIMEIEGSNNDTWLSPQPIAPKLGETLWRHFMFLDKPFVEGGVKKIWAKQSWGDEAGFNGWQKITQDYFNSKHILEAGVVYWPSNPVIVEQRKSLIQQLIALYQQLVNKLLGNTKKPI